MGRHDIEPNYKARMIAAYSGLAASVVATAALSVSYSHDGAAVYAQNIQTCEGHVYVPNSHEYIGRVAVNNKDMINDLVESDASNAAAGFVREGGCGTIDGDTFLVFGDTSCQIYSSEQEFPQSYLFNCTAQVVATAPATPTELHDT